MYECELKYITDLLKVDHVVGENARQESLVREITIPFPVRKITEVETRITDLVSRVIENKVVVEGTLSKKIFFVDDASGQLREFAVPAERFTSFVDVPGAEPGMNVHVRVRVEFVGHQQLYKTDCETIFRQTAILEIFAKVTKSIQQNVVVDVLNIDPCRVIKKLIKVEAVVGEDSTQVQVESILEFNCPIRTVKTIEARIKEYSSKIIEDKVIVEGVLHKQLFIVDEAGEVTERSVDEHFTAFIDIPKARLGMNVQVYPRVEDVAHHITGRGETVKQLAILDIFVKVTETIQLKVVVDIINYPCVQKELLKLAQVVGEKATQLSVIREIDFGTKVRKIITPPRTEIKELTTRIIPDKVIVEGVLHKNIFFVEENSEKVLDIGVDEPFRTFIDIPGAKEGMNVQVYPRVELVTFDFVPGDEKARQTAILEVFVKVTESIQQEVVIVEKPCPDDVTIKVYIVQPCETLAEIAQRFCTTVDAILAINPEIKNPDLIFPGQKILIPVPRPCPPPCPPPCPAPQVYIVKSGDTLFKIAQRFCTTVDAILAINPSITNPDLIFPGQRILIPCPTPCPPSSQEYIVKSGDTLFKIAQRFCTTVAAILAINPSITNPNLIFPGQRICVPMPQPCPPPPCPTPCPPAPCPPQPCPTPCPPSSQEYIVKSGDTLFKIAQRFCTTVAAILAINPSITNPNLIFPGQRICVPC